MFDITSLVTTVGYAGLFAITFAESGLLIGFFLPGDSLLFTAGFLASQGIFDIGWLIPLLFVAAVTGDSVGYAFGRRVGPKIFTKQDSIIFHKDNLERAQVFFDKHGGKTIVLARFLPVIRTFAPILAGVGKMKYSVFFAYNLIGGVVWAIGLLVLGYFLGRAIPSADRYILPIVGAIIIISIAPQVIHFLRDKKLRQATWQRLRSLRKK